MRIANITVEKIFQILHVVRQSFEKPKLTHFEQQFGDEDYKTVCLLPLYRTRIWLIVAGFSLRVNPPDPLNPRSIKTATPKPSRFLRDYYQLIDLRFSFCATAEPKPRWQRQAP